MKNLCSALSSREFYYGNFIRVLFNTPHRNLSGSMTFCKKLSLAVHCQLSLLLLPQIVHSQNWDEIIKVNASDRDSLFEVHQNSAGQSVAIFGNTAVVAGVSFYDNGGIFIFRKDNGLWQQVQRIVPENIKDGLGTSVAIDGEYMVVGAPNTPQDSIEPAALAGAGSVSIYKWQHLEPGKWGLLKKLKASNPMAADQFGYDVDISGDYIIVGAPNEDEDANAQNYLGNSGSAFIFRKDHGGPDNWGQVGKITAANRRAQARFGASVSIDPGMVLVGAAYNRGNLQDIGTAEFFILNTDLGLWEHHQSVAAPVAQNGNNFGFSVQLDGINAVIGAPGEDPENAEVNYLTDAGFVYVFSKKENGLWAFESKLAPSIPKERGRFGGAVSISGNHIVSAPTSTARMDSNNAFVFEKTSEGWVEQSAILATDIAFFDPWDIAFALNQNEIFIGVKDESSTYVYALNSLSNNWERTQKLKGRILTHNYRLFGYAVAVDGDYAVVGAPTTRFGESGYYRRVGAVYILHRVNGKWKNIKTLRSTNPPFDDDELFGSAVAIYGNNVAVGALPAARLSSSGTVYIFNKDFGGTDNWGFVKQLYVSTDDPRWRGYPDRFGSTLAFHDDVLVVGAPDDNKNIFGTNSIRSAGSVFIFSQNQGGNNKWGMLRKITAPIRIENAQFGCGVAFDGTTLVVGSPADNNGSLFIYGKDHGGAGNWGLVKKVLDSDQLGFGAAVGVSGDYIVTASRRTSSKPSILYRNQGGENNWGVLKKLEISLPNAPLQNFIDIDGDYVVIGVNNAAGEVSVFERNSGGGNNWGQSKVLTSPIQTEGDAFGWGVSISNNCILIGAPYDDENTLEENFLSDAGSVYFVNRMSPYPVTLASFKAIKVEGAAHLVWKTATEVNASYFEIQRSADGKSWLPLANVSALGTPNTSYSYTDGAPFAGENFYRLKMVDYDDSFAYSTIQNLKFALGFAINIFPSPTTDIVRLHTTDWSRVALVQILNSEGKTFYKSGDKPVQEVNVSLFHPGLYIVVIKLNNGQESSRLIAIE